MNGVPGRCLLCRSSMTIFNVREDYGFGSCGWCVEIRMGEVDEEAFLGGYPT